MDVMHLAVALTCRHVLATQAAIVSSASKFICRSSELWGKSELITGLIHSSDSYVSAGEQFHFHLYVQSF